MAIVKYKDLHRWTGRKASNVRCGLIRGGKRILGCGKIATPTHPHQGFWYKRNGLVSSVYLCDKCAKKV